MIILFISALFLTLIITRIFANKFHDRKDFGTKNEKSKTLTGWLRIKTGLDLHHFHLGIIILIVILPTIFFYKITTLNIIMLGISLSLVADQIIPFFNRKTNYFNKRNIFLSLILHIIIAVIAFFITLSQFS